MEIINAWLKSLQQWFAYVSYCIEQPMQAPVCRSFWTWVMIGAFAIGVFTVIVIAWKLISYKLKYAASLRAQAARERVDHDAINAGQWHGDKAYSAELGGEEIERQIRQAVDQRRLGNTINTNKSNIV